MEGSSLRKPVPIGPIKGGVGGLFSKGTTTDERKTCERGKTLQAQLEGIMPDYFKQAAAKNSLAKKCCDLGQSPSSEGDHAGQC